ncbi:MAG TPA: DUF1634 domain-containing protein [Vicinamibacterales bacterium]|nr:DUF1634 domain-containing protein [Vicinamibacterales bacterium]
MIERLFVMNGHLYTALLGCGLLARWAWPESGAVLGLLHAGLLLLILTPVTRVVVACARYLRAGDRGSAAMTLAILAVIAFSAWAGAL